MRRKGFAERRFERADGKGAVRLVVMPPEEDRATGDWCCKVEIYGLDGPDEHHEGWGTDGLQALIAALQGLSAWMEPHHRQVRWRGDAFLGLPVYVPHGLGQRIDERLVAAVDHEMQKIALELGRSARRRRNEKRLTASR